MLSPAEAVAAYTWLRVSAIAAHLDTSTDTVLRLIASGDLPAIKLGGEYRVDPKEFAAWIERRRVKVDAT